MKRGIALFAVLALLTGSAAYFMPSNCFQFSAKSSRAIIDSATA